MNLKQKGQASMEAILGIPVTIIGLVVMFLMLDPIGTVLFDVLNDANSDVITQVSTIKLMIGLIGLIAAIMVLVSIINSFRAQPQMRYQ